MNKKIFGIKISMILQALLCLVLAFVIWLTVKYNNTEEAEDTAFIPDLCATSSCETL